MRIILFDGSQVLCREIEMAADGKSVIVDGSRVIPLLHILRIVTA